MTVPTPRRWEAVRASPTVRADEPTASSDRLDLWALATLGLGLLALGLWIVGMTGSTRPMASTPLVFPAVVVVGVLLVRRTTSLVRAPDLRWVLGAGFAARLVGLWYRYENAADGVEYHEEGIRLAGAYRGLELSADVGRDVPGTGTVRIATGVLHAIGFDDMLLAYAVFTVAAFAGYLLLIRALHLALPDASLRRYAILLMVWPSLVLWPSSLGKEAWMILGLGLASLGVAHLLGGHGLRGLAWLAVGLVTIGLVRPHVGLLVVAALTVAVLLRRTDGHRGRVRVRVLVAAIALIGGVLLADATANRFQVDNLGADEIETTLTLAADQTSTGGANFSPARVRTPLDVPLATVTVLFRPLPFEARGLESIASSAEGVGLALLLALSWRRVLGAARRLRTDPYLLYVVVYVLTFVYAFSAIGNFGILARQRSQLLPLLFVLAVMPAVQRARDRTRADRRATSRPDERAPRARSTDQRRPGRRPAGDRTAARRQSVPRTPTPTGVEVPTVPHPGATRPRSQR